MRVNIAGDESAKTRTARDLLSPLRQASASLDSRVGRERIHGRVRYHPDRIAEDDR